MIKTLSPYYVDIPLNNETDYKLDIFIWQGLDSAVPAQPEYSITKENFIGVGTDKIDISRLVNDFIEFNVVKKSTGLKYEVANGVNQVWVKYELSYEGGAVAEESTQFAVRGYAYGNEGENTQLNKILIPVTSYNVPVTGLFYFPYLPDGSDIVLTTATDETTITTITTNQLSESQIRYIIIDLNQFVGNWLEISYNSEVVTLYKTEECRYTPYQILFQNKNGSLQTINFFKERKDSLSVTAEDYESNLGQPINGFHQFKRFNVQGRQRLNLSSGFVDESQNEVFKQLFLSERIWLINGSTLYQPLKISSSSLEFKTRQKDRLINYEVEFEHAYNEINNI